MVTVPKRTIIVHFLRAKRDHMDTGFENYLYLCSYKREKVIQQLIKPNIMKKILLALFLLIGSLSFSSCLTQQPSYINLQNDFNTIYGGKSKSYIIDNFPYPITDIKRIDNETEILIFERYRNAYVGNGITYFYMRNGTCYQVRTNEYNPAN